MFLKLFLSGAVNELLDLFNGESTGLGLGRRHNNWFRNRLRDNYRLGNRFGDGLCSCFLLFNKFFRLRVELVFWIISNFNFDAVFLLEVEELLIFSA
jgi:hypothetical protein